MASNKNRDSLNLGKETKTNKKEDVLGIDNIVVKEKIVNKIVPKVIFALLGSFVLSIFYVPSYMTRLESISLYLFIMAGIFLLLSSFSAMANESPAIQKFVLNKSKEDIAIEPASTGLKVNIISGLLTIALSILLLIVNNSLNTKNV